VKQLEWERVVSDLRQVEDIDRAVEASFTLARIAGPSRIPDLYDLLEDPDDFVREAAADPLAHLEGIRAIPALFRALTRGIQEGHDNDSLHATLSALLEAHQQQAVLILTEMLNDASSATRANAAWGLGFVSSEASPDVLVGALRDENANVRSAAAASLASFKGDLQAVDSLIGALKDSDEQVRIAAAHALGYGEDKRAVSPLREAQHDPSESVRTFATRALKQLGEKA
jgi:bilin biosynthesis protein